MADLKINVDLSPQGIAEALSLGIDALTEAPLLRYKEAELENQAKLLEMELKVHEVQAVLVNATQDAEMKSAGTEIELQRLESQKSEIELQRLKIEQTRIEVMERRLEVENKRVELAIVTAKKMINLLSPDASTETKAMLVQTLLPNLIQLGEGKGLELNLASPEETQDPESPQTKENQLFLTAFVDPTLKESEQAGIGKAYSVSVGISWEKRRISDEESGNLSQFNLFDPISIDILLLKEKNIKLTTDWRKHILINASSPPPKIVEFTFQMLAQGPASFILDFYYERRWLKTITVEFDVFEKSELSLESF